MNWFNSDMPHVVPSEYLVPTYQPTHVFAEIAIRYSLINRAYNYSRIYTSPQYTRLRSRTREESSNIPRQVHSREKGDRLKLEGDIRLTLTIALYSRMDIYDIP